MLILCAFRHTIVVIMFSVVVVYVYTMLPVIIIYFTVDSVGSYRHSIRYEQRRLKNFYHTIAVERRTQLKLKGSESYFKVR